MVVVLCSGKAAERAGEKFLYRWAWCFLQNSSTFDAPRLQPEPSRKLCDPPEDAAYECWRQIVLYHGPLVPVARTIYSLCRLSCKIEASRCFLATVFCYPLQLMTRGAPHHDCKRLPRHPCTWVLVVGSFRYLKFDMLRAFLLNLTFRSWYM